MARLQKACEPADITNCSKAACMKIQVWRSHSRPAISVLRSQEPNHKQYKPGSPRKSCFWLDPARGLKTESSTCPGWKLQQLDSPLVIGKIQPFKSSSGLSKHTVFTPDFAIVTKLKLPPTFDTTEEANFWGLAWFSLWQLWQRLDFFIYLYFYAGIRFLSSLMRPKSWVGLEENLWNFYLFTFPPSSRFQGL